MNIIITFRDYIKRIYGNFDMFIKPVIRFVLAFICLYTIQKYLGYHSIFSGIPVLLVCSLFCIFFNTGCIAVVSGLMILVNMYEISYSMTAFMFLLLLGIWILYFGFRPGNGVIIALIPVAFILKIPYIIPLVLGLSCSMITVIPTALGIVVWFALKYFKEHSAGMVRTTSSTVLVSEFSDILNSIIKNKAMLIIIAVFIACVFVVFMISHLRFNHTWTIAVGAGAVILFAGMVLTNKFTGSGSTFAGVGGYLISVMLAFAYELVFYAVDFKNTENLSFEDDEYYYYVKAVPKIKASDKEERRE